jgi:SagB-type dehydrogenase family enzyme
MDIIDLGSPEPRENLLTYVEFQYPIVEIIYLPRPLSMPQRSFSDVLKKRRTRREFAELPRSDLSALLWYGVKTRFKQNLESGHKWYHRPVPSAGGRHPIDLLLIDQGISADAVYLYNPIAHAISKLAINEFGDLEGLLAAVNAIVNMQNATVVWFAAQFKRATSAYKNATTLLYQDAGVLIATLGLVSEALGLNFCPIGITGDPWVFRMLRAKEYIRGAGGCLVGSRP